MVNNLLLISGIGMMLVGIIIPICYWKTKKVSVKFFAFGAALWIFAITLKIIMDLTISPFLSSYLFEFGTVLFVILYGFYVGFRTGIFESGLTYIIAIKTKLKNLNYKQAFALGLGFGGFEAAVIGFLSFINILVFVVSPDIINLVPDEAQRQVLITSLNQPTILVGVGILERIVIIPIHVFTTLLVFYTIKSGDKKYLFSSIGFKTIVDGIIPALQVYVGTQTVLSSYLMELPFIGLGIIAIGGIFWIKKLWNEKS